MICPFCQNKESISKSKYCFSIFDKYPVTKGHILIIPKHHTSSWFDLSIQEQSDCMNLVSRMKEYLQEKYNPDGFNIGINIGESAGQTINHVHIHLIPRYKGDCEDPTGGVRGVIPEKQKY